MFTNEIDLSKRTNHVMECLPADEKPTTLDRSIDKIYVIWKMSRKGLGTPHFPYYNICSIDSGQERETSDDTAN